MTSYFRDEILSGGQGALANSAPGTRVNDPVGSGLYGDTPDYRTLSQNSTYKPQRLIPVLLTYPKGYDYLPDDYNRTMWKQFLKALFETHSHSITGIRNGLTVENSTRVIDNSGRELNEWLKTTEELSTPTHEIYELQGTPFYNFARNNITLFMGDSVSQIPQIVRLPGVDIDNLPHRNLSFYSFSGMYIEPDITRRFVERVTVMVGMYFNTSGVLESQAVVGENQDAITHTYELGGVQLPETPQLRALAQQYLDGLQMVGSGATQQSTFVNDISNAIDASFQTGSGYAQDMARKAGA